MVRLETRPRRFDQILSQRASDSLVLLNLDDGQYCALNEVGSRVWELCDGDRSVADVVSIICDEYDAPRQTVLADVLEVLGDLASQKLLVAGE